MNKVLLALVGCLIFGFTSCGKPAPPVDKPVADEAEQSVITTLAIKQLDAYNRADLDGFCACYHADVRVFDGEEEKPPGIEAFRARYAKMFSKGGFGASVPTRVSLGKHCVDLEHWWRESGKRGEVLVRYTEKDGLIGTVQFLR
ncbi:nuclear transport factor 2 family protein [Mariniblastus fucicola]|uniref:SnoaL-like domain-containing protein n=1 Tax=Mariniblastus fucicola TaxID=980251 RepID=A0A5B9PHI1_9BACT|nr:nuclear transport factor 2 family protein [Mariniblastus fucicola]QEG24096.1 hypothetical protein MFFC18_40120 [Mariniblastus fucicola]